MLEERARRRNIFQVDSHSRVQGYYSKIGEDGKPQVMGITAGHLYPHIEK